MRQGLVAWLLMGVLALTAFDAFESFKTPAQDTSTELTTDDVIAAGKEGGSPPPTGSN